MLAPVHMPQSLRRWLLACTVPLAVAALAFGASNAFPASGGPPQQRVELWLTLLHNNDGESQLVNAGPGSLEEFGGVARFATVVRNLRQEAKTSPARTQSRSANAGARGSLLVSSGDNFLAGAEFAASLNKGVPFYDGIALDAIGYDAIAIGNHEFDFGPDVFADFVTSLSPPTPFLSANLDVSAEPRLAALRDEGRIARSTVVRVRGREVGIVGATTPRLPFISSPRAVAVGLDVRAAVQAEIDALLAAGVSRIVLISHLQSIQEDLALIPTLRGVDIAVAGGGSEILAGPDDRLLPGDETRVFGPYPLLATDVDGRTVRIVTTSGDYRYVGRLVVGFDAAGEIVIVDEETSGPVRVAGGAQPDAVAPDAFLQTAVVAPVQAAIATQAANVFATSEVALDGRRTSVRALESNEGNLVADAILWQARALAPAFGLPAPRVAFQNGGGIRNNAIVPVGPLSELTTFAILPFANFVSVISAVPAARFKEVLENAVSRVEFGDGRFAQVAGFRFTWDPAAPARTLDPSGGVISPGARVLEVSLDDGTPIVAGGVVVPGAPAVEVATIDFLATGGDQYPLSDLPFVRLGATYQRALQNYLVDGLGGLVSAADYPEGGEGRITRAGIAALAPGEGAGSILLAADSRAGALALAGTGRTAALTFSLEAAAEVSLTLHDVRGRRVATLAAGPHSAGRHEARWNGLGEHGGRAPRGVYFARLSTGTRVEVVKLVRTD